MKEISIEQIKDVISNKDLDLRYYSYIDKNYDIFYHIKNLLEWKYKYDNIYTDIYEDLMNEKKILELVSILAPDFKSWMGKKTETLMQVIKTAVASDLESEIKEILPIIKKELKIK